MIVHNIDPVFYDLGILQIRWYSLAYIFGIIIGWFYAKKIIKELNKYNNPKSIKPTDFDDLIIYLVIGIILGGRLGYIFFYNLEYYSKNLLDVFMIWEGGMSFHGGLLGVITATLIFTKINKTNFFIFTDIISCVAPIGIFFGRIANFINGELYGKVSTLPWSVIFPSGGNISRHPSQIYEALLEGFILFIVLNFFAIKKKMLLRPGYISVLFLTVYSILRIIGENFREPDKHLGYVLNNLSMGSLLSLITFFIGLIIIYFLKKNEQLN